MDSDSNGYVKIEDVERLLSFLALRSTTEERYRVLRLLDDEGAGEEDLAGLSEASADFKAQFLNADWNKCHLTRPPSADRSYGDDSGRGRCGRARLRRFNRVALPFLQPLVPTSKRANHAKSAAAKASAASAGEEAALILPPGKRLSAHSLFEAPVARRAPAQSKATKAAQEDERGAVDAGLRGFDADSKGDLEQRRLKAQDEEIACDPWGPKIVSPQDAQGAAESTMCAPRWIFVARGYSSEGT